MRVRAGAASLPGRLASRSRVAPTHTQRLPPPLKITAASLSHRLARHRGRGEHRVMFATWPGSSTVDASHASEVKSIYASARCTCTRLVGTLLPLAPPSVRGERSNLCKQVLTEDSTSSPSPSLSRAKVSGCGRSVGPNDFSPGVHVWSQTARTCTNIWDRLSHVRLGLVVRLRDGSELLAFVEMGTRKRARS